MLTWPSELPLPLLKTHRLLPRSQLVASEMDSGFIRLRRRRISSRADMPVSWLFNESQAEFFFGWFDIAIHAGAASFYFPVLLPGGRIVNCRAHFIPTNTPYQANCLAGGIWEISAKLAVFLPTITQSELLEMSVENQAESIHFILRHVISQRMPLLEDG